MLAKVPSRTNELGVFPIGVASESVPCSAGVGFTQNSD